MFRISAPLLLLATTVNGGGSHAPLNVFSDDKMRSCLDSAGNRVTVSYAASDCVYTTQSDGSFDMFCRATFKSGEDAHSPGDDERVDAVCGDPKIRECDDPDVVEWFGEIPLAGVFCDTAPDYLQILQKDGDVCTCTETFSTPPLVGNCGIIEPDEDLAPEDVGDDGRAGCDDWRCLGRVCSWDTFCCGDFGGWWDRFCISFAGTQKECLAVTSSSSSASDSSSDSSSSASDSSSND